ncbi:MAG: HAMP domain-containing histidine kinase [Chloroflexi bacterium]|nr:HAMP domain-containing histidine kinase [Chloroflexota bacterium]
MTPGAPPPVVTRGKSPDAALLRRVRWRLVLWSGGTTLVVLLVLGSALYATLANDLGSAGRNTLTIRAEDIKRVIANARRFPPERLPIGFSVGGPASGTFAYLVLPDDSILAPAELDVEGLPDRAGIAAARAGRLEIRELSVEGIPVRVLSESATGRAGIKYVLQVVQDRTGEQRLLDAVMAILIGGGLVALLGATVAGTLYAQRALIPIRESLRRQREFAADASHELRTPLAVIRSSVDLLERHRDEPVGQVGEAVRDIRDEVEHLSAMVGDLLMLARTDSGAIELERVAVDLADIAEGAVSVLTPLAAEKGVRIVFDPVPAPALGDPGRLRQLVTILADNAIAHSPEGSTVTVSVGRQSGGVRLTVDDQGPGFRAEDLPHIFDRFYRSAGAPEGGTGLGLAIARWVTEQHHGAIRATNLPIGGARMDVWLPAAV